MAAGGGAWEAAPGLIASPGPEEQRIQPGSGYSYGLRGRKPSRLWIGTSLLHYAANTIGNSRSSFARTNARSHSPSILNTRLRFPFKGSACPDHEEA